MSGVKVSRKSGLMGMGFYANYTYHNGAYDRIDSCYDYWVKVVLGSHSVESFGIIKKDEDANGPARAMLKISVYYPHASGVDWLYLNVGEDKAWTDEN